MPGNRGVAIQTEAFRTLSKEQFLSDQDSLDIACHRLLIATEAAINLCYHVSAKQLRKAPGEYAECFDLLQQAQIIPADLAKRLQQRVRYRNLLVHMYWKLDYERVYEIIHSSRLGDLRLRIDNQQPDLKSVASEKFRNRSETAAERVLRSGSDGKQTGLKELRIKRKIEDSFLPR